MRVFVCWGGRGELSVGLVWGDFIILTACTNLAKDSNLSEIKWNYLWHKDLAHSVLKEVEMAELNSCSN